MTTNFRFTSPEANATDNMMASDLEVGQKLIRVITPSYSFGDISGTFRTVEYEVKKVLKTRVVLEPTEALSTNVGKVKAQSLRLIVESGKWAFRGDRVTTAQEGTSDNYRREEYKFATVGDPVIEVMRKHFEGQLKEQETKRAARAAIDKIKGSMHYDLESVEETIKALQELADQMRGEASA